MNLNLRDYQLDAIGRMRNGCILCGGVGSGKSRTSLAYYFECNGGNLHDIHSKMKNPKDLYIITTARKRDTLEWDEELVPFLLSQHNNDIGAYHNKVVIDSWNNITKYDKIEGAFFIFDEQRVVGRGQWVKSFLKIAKSNEWILLSATPGDTWQDYIPVFIANGYYKNRSEFDREHVVYKRFSKFPQVDHYVRTGKLIKQRNDILVDMDFKRETISHHEYVPVKYDVDKYHYVVKNRWDIYKSCPISSVSEYCYTLRRVINSDISRQTALLEILEDHPKAIVFYNFDYELEILKDICKGRDVAEWNGHKHEPIPNSPAWVYLVQYSAGAEGWNCIETDTMIFYSQNYSYKVMVQSSGRIDRMNTPFVDLYFYHLRAKTGIDLAISQTLQKKKKFNEAKWAGW